MISFKSNVFYDKVYGRCLEIKTNKDIFKKINDTKELKDAAYKLILNGNKKFQTITDKIDNKEIKFARISAKEYVYGRNSQKLKKSYMFKK